MLWEVDIYPAPGQPDLLGRPIAAAAAELGLAADLKVFAARGYLIQADWDRCQVQRIAVELLADTIVEKAIVAEVGGEALNVFPAVVDGEEEKGRKGEREKGSGEDADIPPSPFPPSPFPPFSLPPLPFSSTSFPSLA